MYRQHVLMQAMVAKAKNLTTVSKAPQLVDTAMSTIYTDLTRTQLFDIAAIFRGVQPADLRTASLTGTNFRGAQRQWFYRLDMDRAHAYVDWLVRGDDRAERRLIPVVVENGTDVPGLARRAADALKAQGFTDVSVGGNVQASVLPAHTIFVDVGVVDSTATAQIATLLGLPDVVREQPHQKGDPQDDTPAALTVTLGQDYAAACGRTVASGAVSRAEGKRL